MFGSGINLICEKKGYLMGEIKSTLDLVMEKTKHLSLSEEEKQNNNNANIENKINGLLNKYEDNTLRHSEFEKEANKLQKQYGGDFIGGIAEEVLKRIDLEKDNRLFMGILKDLCNMQTEPIEVLIDNFKEKVQMETNQQKQPFLERLAKEHCISGSAVEANLENDELLKKTLKALKLEFKNRMASLEKFPGA